LKVPRDVSGEDLVRSLRRFGYQPTRQSGSHIRLTSKIKGTEHHVTIFFVGSALSPDFGNYAHPKAQLRECVEIKHLCFSVRTGMIPVQASSNDLEPAR
jgi:predicted RNA binding protein YcfA (HicA-like mRNA interferase family)